MNDGRSLDGTRQVIKGPWTSDPTGSLSGTMWLHTVASLGLQSTKLAPVEKGVEN